MKRARTKESSSSCSFSELPLSVVHTHVGGFLSQSPRDYVFLALSSKRLWAYYCNNDAYVKCMQFAWKHVNKFTRPTYLLHSNIPTCLMWLWNQERKNQTQESIVPPFLNAGAKFGNLDVIRTFSNFLPKNPEERFNYYVGVLENLLENNHEKLALDALDAPSCVGFNELAATDAMGALTLFYIGARNVLAARSYYARAKELLIPHLSFDCESDRFFRCLLVCAIISDDAKKIDTFAFFWNQDPHIRHAQNFIVFLLTDEGMENLHAVPWVMTRFFASFSKFEIEADGMVQFIEFDDFIFHLKSTHRSLDDPWKERQCIMTVVYRDGLSTRFFGTFPARWC